MVEMPATGAASSMRTSWRSAPRSRCWRERGCALAAGARHLEAIAPGSTLLALLSEQDPALHALSAREKTRRVRDMTAAELEELDF